MANVSVLILLILYIPRAAAVYLESECDTTLAPAEENVCQPGDGEEEPRGSGQVAPMALVLYDENAVSPLFKTQRTFNFSGKEVVVKQNWQDVGIAAVVWDAAVVLGEYLASHTSLIRDCRVIELGAGTGLAGIVAAIWGADVRLTDLSLALNVLRENIAANQVAHPDMKTTVSELTWGQNLDEFEAKYDVILGADIVYIRETFMDLIKTLKHLSDGKTVILMSSKLRYDRDTEFYQLMSESFSISEVHYDKIRDIHVYSAKKLS